MKADFKTGSDLMEFNKKEFLESRHTKQLLKMLSSAREHCGVYEFWREKEKGGYEIIEISADELREELSKREHVPSKLEGKRKRQQMAKQKK